MRRTAVFLLLLAGAVLVLSCVNPAGVPKSHSDFKITSLGWVNENIDSSYWTGNPPPSTAFYDFWVHYQGSISFADIASATLKSEVDGAIWNLCKDSSYLNTTNSFIGGWKRWYDSGVSNANGLPIGPVTVQVTLTDGTKASYSASLPAPGSTTTNAFSYMVNEDATSSAGATTMLARATLGSSATLDATGKTATLSFSVNDPRVANGEVSFYDLTDAYVGTSDLFFDTATGNYDSSLFAATPRTDGGTNQVTVPDTSISYASGKSFQDIAKYIVELFDGKQYGLASSLQYDSLSVSSYGNLVTSTGTSTGTGSAPIVSAGIDQNAVLNDTVSLQATSTPTTGVVYSWFLASKPVGSKVSIADASLAQQNFSPDEPGAYHFTLSGTAGGLTSNSVEVIVYAYKRRMTGLPANIVAAEYDKVHDRIVIASSAPNQLTLVDPATSTSSYVSLGYAPTCLAIDPAGTRAAIGHDGALSVVDISTASPAYLNSYPLTANGYTGATLKSVAVDGSGNAYCFPTSDQWISLREINLDTGTQTFIQTTNGGLYAGATGSIRPQGDALYWVDSSISPRNLHRMPVSVQPVPASSNIQSQYSGDYPMTGPNIWFDASGNNLILNSATVFTSAGSGSNTSDMLYVGSLYAAAGNSSLKAFNSTLTAFGVAATPSYALVPSTSNSADADANVIFIDPNSFSVTSNLPLPDFIQGNVATRAHGYWDFWRNDGSELYVIVKSDGAVMASDYDLVTY